MKQKRPKTTSKSFIPAIISTICNLIPSFSVICSGGVCYTLPLTTVSTYLGAFGITVFDVNDLMFPLALVFIAISLFSLYWKKKNCLYPPFLVGLVAASIIISSHILEAGFLVMLTGNILMMVAAIMNSKVGKFAKQWTFSSLFNHFKKKEKNDEEINYV